MVKRIEKNSVGRREASSVVEFSKKAKAASISRGGITDLADLWDVLGAAIQDTSANRLASAQSRAIASLSGNMLRIAELRYRVVCAASGSSKDVGTFKKLLG